MTIDINGNGSAHLPPALTGTPTGNGNAPANNDANTVTTGSVPTGSQDTVSLTGTAQHLRRLEEGLAQQPVVDTQRVEATKRAIEDGSYQIDPSRIASKMMDLERALYGAR